jgi:hypothetical protein
VTVSSRLVDLASRMLEPDERDAVRGDLAESEDTDAQALREMAGLVVRRQAALWTDWRPWLALVGLAIPLGLLLSLFIRGVTEGSAIDIWLYSTWWTRSFLTIPGARIDLASNVGGHVLSYLTLISWAWTCGFVLSSLSRRTVWVNGSIFCLVLFAELLIVPQYRRGNSAVFSLAFFRVVFPILLRTLLIVVPALWGMQTARRRATLPLLQTIFWGALIVGLTMQAANGIQGAVFGEIVNLRIAAGPYTMEQGRVMLQWDTRLRDLWPLWRLLPLALMWPSAYMIAIAGWPRFHSGELS